MFINKEVQNCICILKIDREEALNAMNPTVLNELHQNLGSAIKDEDIGVIILIGSGEKALFSSSIEITTFLIGLFTKLFKDEIFFTLNFLNLFTHFKINF